jgi:uncharacterized cupredoxin-like copper-binding protein
MVNSAVILLTIAVVVAAGCVTGPSASYSPALTASAPLASSAARTEPPSSAPATASPGAAMTPITTASSPQLIEVTLTDALRIEPARMSVDANRPVTFEVTNLGALDHEFFVGDAAAQAAHEAEMRVTEQLAPDASNVVSLAPGETKSLTYVFTAPPAEWLAGCHVVGHYAGGMRAVITVSR